MRKLNWGTGIVAAFVLFISFILYFVIKTSTDTTYEYDLVAEDYYKDELEYQQKIDRLENSRTLKNNVVATITTAGILINFPKELNQEDIKGKVSLYRPSNQVLDREIPLSLSNSSLLIPKKVLVDGRWDIHIEWSYKDTKYLYKKSINL
ncbi:FixH family protein [Flavicella sediminum]|uniref:FixH family protein n=1 Tax=Flavicella sediminum TaxID=2585141 RepID=UPI00111DBAC4|nr:FixH family protein [Flavicella sediminum]